MNYQDILKKAVIGIAGCGGLGSNCAVALARVGIGTLIFADFDVIVESNLNRQYFFHNQIGQKKAFALKENIHRINPIVNCEAYDLKIEPQHIKSLFAMCPIIVEAFDKADQKQMLIETILTEYPEKYIISGMGLAGWGANDTIKTIQYDNLFICGDGVTEVSDTLPPLAPRVGIVSHMQANLVLELLLNNTQ